jgi:hypothetical protein
MLRELDSLPDGLLETDSRRLAERLGAPTLIHLPGARGPALFVSVLLHGNETVGWEAVRALLRERLERFGELRLPACVESLHRQRQRRRRRSTPSARSAGLQPGLAGSEDPETLEHRLMRQVVDIMARRGIFASLDLHNNTGLNPHYACVNRLDARFLHLARLFSRTVVYFIRPTGVQSMAMAELAPAVTLECGKVGEQAGIDHAREFVEAVLHLSTIPDHPLPAREIDLFHTVAQIKIPETISFGFDPRDVDLWLDPELERMNFRELPVGTPFARVRPDAETALDVIDELGRDVSARYFRLEDGEWRLRRCLMPSMLTRDETVIRQDCLCYLMERYSIQSRI